MTMNERNYTVQGVFFYVVNGIIEDNFRETHPIWMEFHYVDIDCTLGKLAWS